MVGELRALTARAWRHYRTRGARSLATRVRLGLSYGISGMEPVPHDLPPGVAVSDPRGIAAALDAPGHDGIEPEAMLQVSGWACSRDEVDTVDLYLDGALLERIQPTQPRADVVRRLAHIPQAARSGFSTRIPLTDLPMGRHVLTAAVRDRAGRCRVFTRAFERMSRERAYDLYQQAAQRPPSVPLIDRLRGTGRLPLIHLWVDADADGDLAATVRSIESQDGARWHCTVVAADPARRATVDVLLSTSGDRFDAGSRIDIPSEPAPPPGRYHGFLRAGETLAPHALRWLAVTAERNDADLVYSDHDTACPDGRHIRPWFGPDWSPDHLLVRDYVRGFFIARETGSLPDLISGVAAGAPGWRFALLLALAMPDGPRVEHVPRVLWSAAPDAVDPAATLDAERYAVESVVQGQGPSPQVLDIGGGIRRITWPTTGDPKVSIIIPTTANMAYVRPCVESLSALTSYPHYEVLFLDNGRGRHPDGSDYLRARGYTVLEKDEPFNWAKLNNDGARASSGEILLFLNDDVEIIDGEWLTELVSQAMRPGIGSVGALLLYPDGTIQHAGVRLVGHGGGAMHYFQGQHPDDVYLELHRVTREVSANTGACLAIQRSRFDEIGGFDEGFMVAGNDVDFGLRLIERGYRNLWTPHSRLIHHEGVSRAAISVELDEEKMLRRWGHLLRNGDPYSNPNFAEDRTDCSIDVRSLRRKGLLEEWDQ